MNPSRNRYEEARARIPRGPRREAENAFRALWASPATPASEPAAMLRLELRGLPGPLVVCLASQVRYDDGLTEQHVSVSCGRGAALPSWEILLAVRALAWEDDVEVYQVLPPLTGPSAEQWVSLGGVEVLHLRCAIPGKPIPKETP